MMFAQISPQIKNRKQERHKMSGKRVLPLRIYEVLPDIIDLIDGYVNSLNDAEITYDLKMKELRDFLFHLEKYVDERLFININPNQVFNSIKKHPKADKKFIDSLNTTQKIRQLFFSNQEIRNANLIANYAIDTFSSKGAALSQKKSDDFMNGQTVSQTPPLNLIVDTKMQPIYSSYLHLYEPKYFPSTHKSINSRYIASMLPILFKSNATNSLTAYESQLTNTNEMLSDLIQAATESRTEFQLVQLKRKYPSSAVVVDSLIYKKQKNHLDQLFHIFTQRLNEYNQNMNLLKETVRPQILKMQENAEKLKKKQKEISKLIQQDQEIRTRLEILDYLNHQFIQWQDQMSRSSRLGGPFDIPLTAICQQFEQWDRLKEDLHSCLTKDIPRIRDLDRFLKELPEIQTKLHKNVSLLSDKLLSKDNELKEIYKRVDAKSSQINSITLNAFNESQKLLDDIHKDVIHENMLWLNNLNESKNEYERLLCALSKFAESKPITQLVGDMIGNSKENDENYISEVQRRISEIEEIQKMVDERTQILDQNQMIVENANRTLSSSLGAPSSKDKVVYIEGIDQKYTEDRMFLSCISCDSISEVMLKPCRHRICRKCYEKSKKKRITYCPYCNGLVDNVIEINW